MKRIIRLTENDLARIVRRVIKEDDMTSIAGGCFSKTTYQHILQKNDTTIQHTVIIITLSNFIKILLNLLK